MLKKSIIITVLCVAPLSGNAASTPTQQSLEPAVSIHFWYHPKDLARIRVLQHQLENAIKRAKVGELDDPELHADGNDGYFDMRGPDPEKLYRVVSPILKSSRLMTGAEVTKKSGAEKDAFVIR